MSWTAAVAAFAVLAAGCYLPQSTVPRELEQQVLVAVYRCSEELVAGEIRNDADIDVTVTLRPLWLDGDSQPFHEVVMEPFVVPAGETIEWESPSATETDTPVFCGAELVEVGEG